MRNQPYLCSLFDRLNGEASNKKVCKGFRLIWHTLSVAVMEDEKLCCI
jgi:hypothetical protein